MSKAKRTPGKSSRYIQRNIFGGVVRPRSDEAVQREVMAAADNREHKHLPIEVVAGFTLDRVSLSDVYGTASFANGQAMPAPVSVGDRDVCSMTETTFREIVQSAMAVGFTEALVRYRKQLAAVPALARFYKRQDAGQRRGREVQAQRKVSRAVQAVAMAKRGQGIAEIVAHFRANGMPTCNRSTIYRWLKTPRRSR